MNKSQEELKTISCGENHIHTDDVSSVLGGLPEEKVTQDAADFFKAFSDKTRIRILAALAVQELCVCDIAGVLGMTQSAISHQLRFLKELRLVSNRKEGKIVYYRLDDDHIGTILSQGLAHVQEKHEH